MVASFKWESYKMLRRPAVWVLVILLLASAVFEFCVKVSGGVASPPPRD